jgi:hypothetical protein
VLIKFVLEQRHFFRSIVIVVVTAFFPRCRIVPPRIQKLDLARIAGMHVTHVARIAARRIAARQTFFALFCPQSVHLERLIALIINKCKIIIGHIAAGRTVVAAVLL